MAKSKNEPVLVVCSNCKVQTKHTVVKEVKESFESEDIQGYDTWQIVACNGCETKSFRREYEDSDMVNYETNEYYSRVNVYPIRGAENLQIKQFYGAPIAVRNIYEQTIHAYNYELSILCAAGIRSIIECICKEEGVKDGVIIRNGAPESKRRDNLEGKINGLAEKGILSVVNSQVLHEHRFLGNEAVHDISAPSNQSLEIAIRIIEHTLTAIYELENEARSMSNYRKARKKNLNLNFN